MIKQTKTQMLVLAAIASIGFTAPAVQAKDVVVDGKGEIPYVIDGRNVVARSGADLCWRTGYWSPAAASTAMAGQFPVGCECDSDIVAKDKCVAPVAAAKPAPAPAPKPTADKIKLAAASKAVTHGRMKRSTNGHAKKRTAGAPKTETPPPSTIERVEVPAATFGQESKWDHIRDFAQRYYESYGKAEYRELLFSYRKNHPDKPVPLGKDGKPSLGAFRAAILRKTKSR